MVRKGQCINITEQVINAPIQVNFRSLVTTFDDKSLGNIGQVNGLLHDGTKPIPDIMLISH